MPLLQRIDKLTELSDVAGRTLDCRAAVTQGRWLRAYGDPVIELSVMQATRVNAYARRYYRTSDAGIA